MASVDVRKPVVLPPVPPAPAADLIRTLTLEGNVGFSSLPDQLVQKCIQKGFAFNVLCVGETGIGKSTLIESLFNMKFDFKPCTYELKNVELHSKTFDVEEGNVKVKLTVVETAGFGDQLDKDASIKVISDYISSQYELYLREEMKVERRLELFHDSRIHACLYFISPTGHGLKALDVAALKDLCKRTNVLPIIAKADTISKDDLLRYKSKILSELRTNGVDFYQFPMDDETLAESNARLNGFVPFAVIGSSDFVKHNGKMVRARQYPWGIVEVENEAHCDFVKLRESLLRLNVEDLRERTHCVLFESYRRNRLKELGLKDGHFVEFYEQLRQKVKLANQADNKLWAALSEKAVKKENELILKEKNVEEKKSRAKMEYSMASDTLKNEESTLQMEMAEFELYKKNFLEQKMKRQRK